MLRRSDLLFWNEHKGDGRPSIVHSLRFPTEGEWQHEFIPFGARVNFMRTPTLTKDDKPPKFAPTACEGVLLGYRLQAGGRWKNELRVAELPEFANVDFAYNAKPK